MLVTQASRRCCVSRDATYVVQSRTLTTITAAAGDDLDGGVGAVDDVHGDDHVVKAEVATAGDIHELGGERHVEVGDLIADTHVNPQIGPGMVEGKGNGTALDRPLGTVTNVVGDTTACVSLVLYNQEENWKFFFSGEKESKHCNFNQDTIIS